MKIALINPPHYYKTDKLNPDYLNITGIAYIEAVLRDKHKVKIIDLKYDKTASLDQLEDCEVVGITAFLDCYNFFKETLPKLKKKAKL